MTQAKLANELLAVETKLGNNFQLSPETCIHKIICKPTHVISTHTSGLMNSCIYNLYSNNSNARTLCQFEIKHSPAELFINMEKNSWYYYIVNHTRFTLNCPTQTKILHLQGSGMLKLNNTCTLRSRYSILLTEKSSKSNYQLSVKTYSRSTPKVYA